MIADRVVACDDADETAEEWEGKTRDPEALATPFPDDKLAVVAGRDDTDAIVADADDAASEAGKDVEEASAELEATEDREDVEVASPCTT